MSDEKIVSIEDRIPKLKQQRKKKANRRLIFYLSLFFILISVIIYIQSPLSSIKNIEVTGNKYLSKTEIIEETQLTKDTNIWKVNKDDVKNAIKNDPIIKTVKVKRKLPGTISIELEEYELVGYVRDEESHKPIFENGQQISVSDRYAKGDAPVLLGFDDNEVLQTMTKQLQQLPPTILQLISEIHWEPEDENNHKIILFMNDGFMVDGTIRNFAEKMQVYPSIVSQLDPDKKGIIHIGVGAYFEQFSNDVNYSEE